MLIKSISKDQITIDNTKEAIKFCRKYLPKQGPLEYFVHHNTLHAFEEFNFFDALKYSSSLLGTKSHKTLKWYQSEYKRGRISKDDLLKNARKYIHKIDNDTLIAMLNWNEGVTSSVDSILKDKILSEITHKKVVAEIPLQFRKLVTYWDCVKNENQREGLKRVIKEIKLNFYSAYFDKGLSYWQMEDKEKGLLFCFSNYIKYASGNKIKKGILKFIKDLDKIGEMSQKIVHLLNLFGVPPEYLNLFLFNILYELQGWSALVFSMNENNNYNPTNVNIDIDEYILINLLFEASSFEYLNTKDLLYDFEYKTESSKSHYYDVQSYIYDILGNQLQDKQKKINYYEENIDQISTIDESLLFKIWHEAYEQSLIEKLLTSYSIAHSKVKKGSENIKPSMQVVMCIDDREESARRYFEEYDRSIKTYGYAGHFGLNIQYKSIRDAHFRALCPLSASPDFYVWEELKSDSHNEIKSQHLAKLKLFLFHNSKLPFSGLFLTYILGPFTLMLFVFESFFPEKVHHLRKKLKRLMFPRVETCLNFLSNPSRELRGYTLDEAANVLLSMLKTMGITRDFADIVYICGHGSKSANNPHGAAYNCGACAGGKGAANAWLMATIGNRSDVRKKLEGKGVSIPQTTFFVGGYHCTSSDKFLIFEKESFPKQLMTKLESACKFVSKKDAKERLRKFLDVPLDISSEKAIVRASNRVYDFSQPRPEYGHNTNAICVVGKRENTKNIFLDRRAFLVDYDEKEDNQSLDNLSGLLASVIPVCAGINLEYYFSYVDREKFGAGGKQAHNVTSLMGVMNGYKSDLRLGLPWQMVEIHEPLRAICVIETEAENILKLMDKNQNLKNLIGNDWVKVICVAEHGEKCKYSIFKDGIFEEINPIKLPSMIEKLTARNINSEINQSRDLLDFYIKV